jgi:hypothetical protein
MNTFAIVGSNKEIGNAVFGNSWEIISKTRNSNHPNSNHFKSLRIRFT